MNQILTIIKPFKFQLKNVLLILVVSISSYSCNNTYKSDYYSDENDFDNGIYCAEVEYYYSKSGTSSTYVLEVEVENNEITTIHWPNGGWLDNSQFNSADISNGIASFTSDNGVDYTVKIIGREGDCVTDIYAVDEEEMIRKVHEEEFFRLQEENRLQEEEQEEWMNQGQEESEQEEE